MINNLYTVAELADLRAAKDVDLQDLDQHQADFAPTWVAQDSAGYVAWINDRSALGTRYDAAKSQADSDLELRKFADPAWDILPATMQDADAQYKAVLAALNPSWQQNTNAPGSLGDLDLRLQQASGAPTDYSNQPQPTPGSDFDLTLLQGAGAITSPSKWPWWLQLGVGTAIVAGGTYVADRAFGVLGKLKQLVT
jgi:hypothetical protein